MPELVRLDKQKGEYYIYLLYIARSSELLQKKLLPHVNWATLLRIFKRLLVGKFVRRCQLVPAIL